MNILLINHYAGSLQHGMEYRPYYLAREWVRMGHRVRIVASSYSHVRARQPELGEADRLDETIDGIQYTWFRGPSYSGNGVGRVRNMFAFVWRLFRAGKDIAQTFQPDVVIASSTYPMDIWPAKRIAKLVGAKLIFEVHDLWPLSPMELGGMSKWHPFIMLVQAAEDYAYRNADKVVSMLPKVSAYMESRGMLPQKLHIIPNGVDPAEWSGVVALDAEIESQLADLKAQGFSIVGYAGTHGLANALEVLLEAAKLLQHDKVAFVLIGGGPEKQTLQQRVKAEGLNNVKFFSAVSKTQIPALLGWFDVAYIGWRMQSLYRFGICPNKLMDYMMAGKVILHSVEAGNDPVGESGCGLTVKPDDPQAIVDGVRALLALDEGQRKAMGERGRAYVLAKHSYPELAKQFIEVCS